MCLLRTAHLIPELKKTDLKKKTKKPKKPTPYLCPPRFVLGSAESKITNY